MGSCVLGTNRQNFVPGALRLSIYVIYRLFNDAFSGSDYKPSKDRLISE